MPDLLACLQVALAGRYTIERELGRGGMALVYLARDSKHGRPVALKVLRPELAAALGAERFLREIEIAAQLTHPHILPLHDSGKADDFLYYVMPYVEGESLRTRLNQEKQLPVDDALQVAREVADALSYAHSHNVVHRDVKPENILFEAGHAVVSDFGIARAITAAGTHKLTETGTAVGTPAYMSPEQASGEGPIDGRSDTYALGCLLYEMLAGEPPFTGPSPQAVLARHTLDPPPPLRTVRKTVPPAVEQAIMKALEKVPADRFQTTAQFAAALAPAASGRLGLTVVQAAHWAKRHRAGLVLATLFTTTAVAAVARWLPGPGFAPRDWILLADLENESGDSVFDRSLKAALAVAIAQSRYVNVLSSTRVHEALQRMRRDSVPGVDEALAREVALREGVKAVVVPAIARVDTTYLLTAKLVDPSTGNTLAAIGAPARGKNNVLKALDDLSRQLRRSLGESTASIRQRSIDLPRASTASFEALKRFAEAAEARTAGRWREAEMLLNEAIALDPEFAWAHAELGDLLYWTNNQPAGDVHFRTAFGLTGRLPEREQMWVRSLIAGARGDKAEAIRLLRVYLREYPDDDRAWFSLGRAFQTSGRFQEAIAAYRKAVAIDPHDSRAYVDIGVCFDFSGRAAEALAAFDTAFSIVPGAKTRVDGDLNRMYGFLYLELGDSARARQVFDLMLGGDAEQRGNGLRSLALLEMYYGRYATAIRHLTEALVWNRAANAPVSEFRNRLYLTTAYRAKGQTRAVERELRAAESLAQSHPFPPVFLINLGHQLVLSGHLERARKVLKMMAAASNVESPLDQAVVRQVKGEIALAEGKHTEALETLELAQREGWNTIWEALARAYFFTRDWARAESTYHSVLRGQSLGWEPQEGWLLAHYQLGKIYEEQGDTGQAREWYTRFERFWHTGDSDLVALVDVRRRMSTLGRASAVRHY